MPIVMFKLETEAASQLRRGFKPSTGSALVADFTRLGGTFKLGDDSIGVNKKRHPRYGDMVVTTDDWDQQRAVAELLLRRPEVLEVTIDSNFKTHDLKVPEGQPASKLVMM